MSSQAEEYVYSSDSENLDPVVNLFMKSQQQPSSSPICSKSARRQLPRCEDESEARVPSSDPQTPYGQRSGFPLSHSIGLHRQRGQPKTLLFGGESHAKIQQQTNDRRCDRCGKSCLRGIAKMRNCENCCKLFGSRAALAMHKATCRKSVKSAVAAALVLGFNRSPDLQTYTRLRARHFKESTTTTTIEQICPHETPKKDDSLTVHSVIPRS